MPVARPFFFPDSCRVFFTAQVDSLTAFVDVWKTCPLPPQALWFRGDSEVSTDRKLLPSLARNGGKDMGKEMALYTRFRQNAAAYLAGRHLTPWDWMFYMQHFGIPTRLLDWTENPLVALYFAVAKPEKDAKPAAVWCLDPLALNDAARLDRILCADVDSFLNSYTSETVDDSPIPFQPVAMVGARSFQRLVAQQGVFTVTHKTPIALEDINGGAYVGRVTIDASARADIRAALAHLGFTRLTMFPELQSVADNTKELLK